MVITERVQAENPTRLAPIINKRSSNIRLSNSYDANCDTSSRISDHINEESLNNISMNLNQSTDYINVSSVQMKKDRITLESNIDVRNATNIRLCNSQSNDLNKPDIRQFSPWSAPVRNRVVARVVPYPHTNSNAPSVSHINSNIASKFSQNTIHSIRSSSSTVPQNINRGIHKLYSSYPEKEIQTNKQDSLLSINQNFLHLINDRESETQRRRPNYNQPITYRVKNPDGTPKSFDLRNSSFSGSHNSKPKNYRYSEISEVPEKTVTAAEVFGEDFSDLSDNDSTPSYTSQSAVMVSGSRKRKMMKCKSPSSDSSSTMSVQSSEKQNRFVRISKPHIHSKKTSLHINRNKKPVKIKPCSSSDEQRNAMHNSKLNRHQLKQPMKEKSEKKNISMKPLTVNVSLTNFEDDILESDETSSRTTENSSENSSKLSALKKGCLSFKNKQTPLQINKKKFEKPQRYRNKEHHLSSSSENEYDSKRFHAIPSKPKPYLSNDHKNRKITKYIHDRTYKENIYAEKIMEGGNVHKTKIESDHYVQRKMSYNSASRNLMIARQYREKDDTQIYRDKSQYVPRTRQRSESPPIKRQKLKYEDIEKNSRQLDKHVHASSQIVSRHNPNKHDHKKVHTELSSDAAFQKEFDEFKRDQAGDSVQRKCNSSIMSSASSTGTKSFTSFKKFKSKKQESSSKYLMYDTIDSKNIFQIDMNNINIYESMYDKVKRRAQKQAENKISQHPSDTVEQRNKRKSKGCLKDGKHVSKVDKMYHNRHRKTRDRMSPSSSTYSGASSHLGEDAMSNYSQKAYPATKKSDRHRKLLVHNDKFYKSTKTSVVTSFDSANSHSRRDWKNKGGQENPYHMHKFSQKYKSENMQHNVKHLENDFINEIEEHENNSEFSYITNVSNVLNITSKSSHEYKMKNIEEIGNGSDATASTEPMEYAEVDLESLKLSDDDWKSGLSSQSSSESGAVILKTDIQKMEIMTENKAIRSVSVDKNYSLDRDILSDHGLENETKLELYAKKDPITIEVLEESNCIIDYEFMESTVCTLGIEAEESTKEEQDLAIASIMLKEENDCKSPNDWESRRTDDINLSKNSINSLFTTEEIMEEIKPKDYLTVTKNMELHNVLPSNEYEEVENLEIKSCVPILTEETKEDFMVCEMKIDAVIQDDLISISETSIQSLAVVSKTDPSLSNISDDRPEEDCNKNVSTLEIATDHPMATSDSSLTDNGPIVNSVTSLGLKPQSNTKGALSTSPTVKEDLTSYVKSVIERVKQEQSVENQNKLKYDKCLNKRSKKISGSVVVPNKTTSVPIVVASSGTPVSLSVSLQKSPSVSFQAVVIDNIEHSSPKSSISAAPTIPGVNVCSPVATTISNATKPIDNFAVSSIPTDISFNKHVITRSNVISIINLSSGTPSLKVEPVTIFPSISSELQVNTDLTSMSSVISDVSSVLTDTNSTYTPRSHLKSPNSDDQTKQRICTRLRRADPNKSDGNYKVVMTISTNKSDISNRITTPTTLDVCDQEPNAPKPTIKSVEDDIVTTVEIKSSTVIKISDPYEPNFDESPLELSHYRTKAKNTFFPIEEKPSQVSSLNSSATCAQGTKLAGINTALCAQIAVCHPVSSVIDSLSQVIDDVAHGHFNQSEYLTSFKNGRLNPIHISPSTTPLTFVSNDSRDCSSAGVENITNTNAEPLLHKKANLPKHSNVHGIDDSKKADNTLINHPISATQRHNAACIEMSGSHAVNAKTVPIHTSIRSLNTTKSTISNISMAPIYSTSGTSQYSSELLTLINPAVVCRPIDQKPKQESNTCQDSFQNLAMSSIQIQPFNILSNSAGLHFDKEFTFNNNFQLSAESSLPQNISKNNFVNISVNSVQSNCNPITTSAVQNSDDKAVLKQIYLKALQQGSGIGGIDSSNSFSQLQNMLNEAHLKTINSHTDNNVYKIQANVNEQSVLSLPLGGSNQDFGNVPQNISSKFIAELVIPREYPLVWEGKLSLKNEEATVALHFVHGNSELLSACMHLLIFSGSLQWNNTGSLKIVQRMRLDTSQLEGVQRRMQNTNEYCIGLALPGGEDTNQWMRQSQILKDGFIKYMREKGAAGIINVCHPDNNQHGLYVVHIFPPCEFSTNQLCATAPQLASIIENHKVPSLLVVITTV